MPQTGVVVDADTTLGGLEESTSPDPGHSLKSYFLPVVQSMCCLVVLSRTKEKMETRVCLAYLITNSRYTFLSGSP